MAGDHPIPPEAQVGEMTTPTRHLRLVRNDDPEFRYAGDRRQWTRWALDILRDERERADETPLIPIPLPEFPDIHLLLKDESAHPSGSLKHRLARALFHEAVAGGAIDPQREIVEASSGSTAIAVAWFARLLGLRFTAVVPTTTAPSKIAAIEAQGGRVVFAPKGSDLDIHARGLAGLRGAHYLNQFDRAADAIDWNGSANIAASLLAQLRQKGLGAPQWIVTGAGTAGTAATIGRHIRVHSPASRLCVVDPEGSAYFACFMSGDRAACGSSSPVVEGIGRGRVGRAFHPGAIDHMVAVSDEGSVSGAHWLRARTGRMFGPSTGTNIIGALILAQAMRRAGETGTIALIGNDGGGRYAETIYDPRWCARHEVGPAGWRRLLERLGKPEFPAAY